jgi:hypothetical protein
MVKKNIYNNLFISFKICESRPFLSAPQPLLEFNDSNYSLNKDEILRAKLRPNKLTLDNKIAYIKIDEDAYSNRNGENMLLVKYNKLG